QSSAPRRPDWTNTAARPYSAGHSNSGAHVSSMAKGRKAPVRGASRAKAAAGRGIPPWLWLVSGLVIGIFVAFLFQLEPGRESVKRDTTPPKQVQQKKPTKPAEPQARYDFYTLLPESEQLVPESSVPKQAPPAPPKKED